ncbi:MAG: T9SS type A sorting domain-containing protein [Sphingobacteriales bacterium]|nr:MAG: T9SS type A sorting domain-containing protein [Sphingobacteriales bacterium]
MKTENPHLRKTLSVFLFMLGFWLFHSWQLSAQVSCGLDLASNDAFGCTGTSQVEFSYFNNTDHTLYSIFFDNNALGVGFVDVDDADLPTTTTNDIYIIYVDVPAGAPSGTYTAALQVLSSSGCDQTQYFITINLIPQPTVVVSATPSPTICLGEDTQLNALVDVSNITVVISPGTSIGFLDETTWTMTNSLGNFNGFGGPYAQNSTNYTDLTNNNPPLTFFLETQGIFNDNVAVYNILCNGTTILAGTLPAGQQLTIPNINCIPDLLYQWSPVSDLSDATIADPLAFPSSNTNYNVTVDYLGCMVTSPDILVQVNTASPGAIADNQSICSGGDPVPFVNISNGSATGALSYQWQNSIDGPQNFFSDIAGANAITYDPPPGLTQTTWYRRITKSSLDGFICDSEPSNVVKVLVNPTPEVNGFVSQPGVVCQGDGIQLNGSLSVPTLLLNISGGGFMDETFWTMTDALGQVVATGGPYNFASDNFITIPNANPPLNFTLTTIGNFNDNVVDYTVLCYDEALVAGTLAGGQSLTVPSINCPNGDIQYDWFPTTGLDDPTVANPIASPSVPTTYTLTASYYGCSSTSDGVDVNVILPTPGTIGSNQTICFGGTPNMLTNIAPGTGSSAITYLWQSSTTGPTAGFSDITGAVNATYSPPAGLSVTTWYHRIAIATLNSVSCSSIPSNVVEVTVVPNPSPTISGNPVICQGANTVLGTGLFNTYFWQASNGGSINGAFNLQNITAATAGTYTVTVADANGCTGSASQLVTQIPAPSISFSEPAVNTSCNPPFNGSVSIVSPVGSTVFYQWSNGATTANISQLQGGNYTVTVTDSNGCTGSATITVPQNTSGPIINAIGTNVISCFEDDGSIIINGLAAGTSYVLGYSFNGSVQPNQTQTADALGEISLFNLSAGDYTNIIATSPVGCPSNATNITISGPTLPDISVQTNSPVCEGNLLSLNSIPTGGSGFYTDFIWTGPNDFVAFEEDVTFAATTSNEGIYHVTVTDGNGCTGSAFTEVFINTLPLITITGNLFVCLGESTTLTAFTPEGVDYFWESDFNSPTITYTPIATEDLTVFVTDANGCNSAATVTVTVFEPPVITITQDVDICLGESTLLSAFSPNATDYFWNTSETDPEIFVSPILTTLYTVIVTDVNDCTSTATVLVTVHSPPFLDFSNPVANTACFPPFNGSVGINTTTADDFSFLWSNGATTAFINQIQGGNYIVTVTDNANGCISIGTIDVPQVTNGPFITLSTTPPTTCGGNNGSIILHGLIPGTAYSVAFTQNGSPQPVQTLTANGVGQILLSGLSAGNYTNIFVDISECPSNVLNTVLSNPASPLLTATTNSPVCQGGNLMLNAFPSGGSGVYTGFVWSGPGGYSSNLQNNSLTATATSAGVYSVTVTDSNGCTASANTGVVVINALPTVVVNGGNQTLCAGQTTATISFSGSVSSAVYNWVNNTPSIGLSASGTGNIPAFTALNNTASTVTATISVTPTGNGCVGATQTFTITVLPTPNVTLPANQTLCAGTSTSAIIFSGLVGGTLFNWTNNNPSIGLPSSGTGTISPFSAQNTGITPVSATISVSPSANGCTGTTQSFTITVNPLPNPAPVASPANVCPSGSAVLSAFNGVTYTWNTGQTGSSVTVTPLTNTTYTVTATNATGCSAAGNVSVSVLTPPVATASSSNPCVGGTLTLSSSGGNAYLWSGPNGFSSNQQNPLVSNNSTNVLNGTYSVTVTGANGCTDSASVLVVISSTLSPVITGTTQICSGNSTTLNAGAGYSSYLWNTGVTSQTLTTAIAGNYSVTVSNSAGCTGSTFTSVQVTSPPNAGADNSADICNNPDEGNTIINLNTLITGDPGGVFTPIGGAPPLSNNNDTFDGDGITPGNYQYSYTVAGTPPCPDEQAILTINVNACISCPNPPTANFSYPESGYCLGSGIVNPALLGGAVSGLWSATPGGLSINAFTGIISSNASLPGVYTVTNTVAEAGGCPEAVATFGITIYPLPVANAGADQTACVGDLLIFTASGGQTYQWSNGDSGATTTLIATSATTLTVTVTDSNGCTDTDVVSITANPLPTVAISGSISICNGDNAIITFNGTPNATVVYTLNDSGINQNIVLNAFGVATLNTGPLTTTTVYNLVSVSTTDCNQPVTEAVTVTVIPLPTAIISGTAGVCLGESASIAFNGTPNATVFYTVNGGTAQSLLLNSSGTGLLNTGPVTATTLYSLVSISTAGLPVCSQNLSGTATITVVALPTAIINGSTSICSGESATLSFVGTPGATVIYDTGGSPLSIVLSAGGTATVNTGNLSSTVIYNLISVSTTGAAVCTQTLTGSATVTVFALPSADAGEDQNICAGASTTFTATGGTSYVWSTGGTDAVIAVSPSETTVYTVTVTDDNSCTATDSVVLTVNELPQASIFVSENSGNTTNDNTICSGSSATLTAAGGTDYEWSNGAGFTETINVNPADNTIYSVTVTDSNGCSSSAQTSLVVNPNPSFTIAFSAEQLAATGQLTLNTIPVSETNLPWSYLWSNGEMTENILVSLLTLSPELTVFTISLTVTDNNGCPQTEVFDMAQAIGDGECEWPSIDIKQDPPETGVPKVLICVLDEPDATYQWGYYTTDPFTFAPIPLTENPTAQMQTFIITDPDTTKQYAVLTNYNNCWRMAAFSGKLGQTPLTEDLIQVMPNPNQGSFTLTLQSNYKGNVDVSVCDLSGKICFRQQYNKSEALFNPNITLPAPTGVYLLHITYGQQQQVLKIFKF